MPKDESGPWIASIGEREEELAGRVCAWSEINSGSRNPKGVARMAALLHAELETLTPDVSTFSLPDDEEIQDDGTRVRHPLGPAVRAVCRPDAPVRFFLNGHLDTVFDSEHSFQHPRRDGSRIIGPGVADMKGGLLIMIESLRLLESVPFRRRIGWEVLLTPDEELGSPRSAELFAEAAPRHHAGFIFESALPDGSLVSGRLGAGNFLVRVLGRSAHAGRDFNRGRSATAAVAELITAFHALNREDGVIVNIGRIAGGGPVNIVPAQASCRLNVRIDSSEKARHVETAIRELAQKTEVKHAVQVELHGRFGRPPKPVTPALEKLLAQLRACARENGLDLNWAPTGGASDGNNLSAAGLPTVDSLGVRGGAIHTDQEFLHVASLPERIALFTRFLLKTALQEE